MGKKGRRESGKEGAGKKKGGQGGTTEGRRGTGKEGAGKKKSGQGGTTEYASDDERLYGNFDEPDPRSKSYMYDEVDEFHAGREKILLDEGYKEPDAEEQSDEEILGLDPEESDDDEIEAMKAQLRRIKRVHGKDAIASDIEEDEEGEGEEEGLPDSRAWGVKRNKYYGDDDVELKNLEDEEAAAVMEEKEALKLQKHMAEQLDDADFGLDIFKPTEPVKESVKKEEKIIKDLSKLTKRDKLKLLKKESPELITLIDDFKLKMGEVQEKLCPLRELIVKQKCTSKAADYIHTKFKLNMNYCINILFYLMMKAKQAPVHNHPVIKRLLQYRGIMKELEPLDEQMCGEIEEIVSRLQKGEDVDLTPPAVVAPPRTFVRRKADMKRKQPTRPSGPGSLDSGSEGDESDDLYEELGKPSKAKKKAAASQGETTEAERAALEYYDMMKKKGQEDSEDDEEEQGGEGEDGATQAVSMETEEYYEDMDGKRAITYQIEKNKGLTARKKKELRNPRVKHRMKFRKAKIRRTGQFRTPRTEMQKYGGEVSGIRLGVKRGVKLH